MAYRSNCADSDSKEKNKYDQQIKDLIDFFIAEVSNRFHLSNLFNIGKVLPVGPPRPKIVC
ncbi:MAG: hypothetical protein R2911_44350 [Caldilineaceae bacterium]